MCEKQESIGGYCRMKIVLKMRKRTIAFILAAVMVICAAVPLVLGFMG